ncbi:non-reducing end alpha-L-arabinofuranosidase family hydrolase [Glycomyces harbinensis]|uniref:non-reducing end alpha-L-arabinofuranosidase n=1 Tax=Glycomyces harbinensis TaxID=58114 RepID=A0A1G6QSQ7_9ACTN|nr:non-reducing end alpha-L-arabinofuranosidase family hydrolase [Glycomyces harbinensis]SDC95388.1 endo-1,4-beta-xylanase [Glycomyces harbinensis]
MRRTLRTKTLGALAALAAAAALAASMLTAGAQTTADDDAGAEAQALPTTYSWESTGAIIGPKPNSGHNVVSAKDPTVVQDASGKWHVFFTVANTAGAWSLAYTGFNDWSQASSAPHTFLDTNPNIGSRYAAAPHVFFYEPSGLWYLVYQTGLPSYSTTSNINDPGSWSAPRNFQNEMPQIVKDNIGNGHWLDYWVICDSSMCYLFSADDNGHVYRAETTVANFPNGFTNTKIVLQDTKNNLFEGGAVYKVDNTNTYLLIWESIGSDGARYYRSYTANGLNGQWQPQATGQNAPFAGAANVSFPGGAWTKDISHGELLRSGRNQTMPIDTGNLQMLYQGRNPNSGGDYSQLPYRLGLLTLEGGASC